MVPRSRLLLYLTFSLALFLRLFRVGLDGLGNLYYAASVRSMLTGWHNFFFASFDPAGFLSIDKPPLGFWIQALSVTLFGFHGWALILPQALAGALSTLVLYLIVKRASGETAGLTAGLILAVTPISVAADRSNTPDGQLLLLLLLGAFFALKAAESGHLGWLLASAAFVGLGFNVKMLQAYLVAPAFLVFLPPPVPLLKRLAQVFLAAALMLAVSLAWPLFVDATPVPQRPFVGSTVTNRVLELAAVHNGARRLGPIAAWFGIRPQGPAAANATAQLYYARAVMQAPGDGAPRVWPDGGQPEVGDPGLLRLFSPQLGGQVTWLLPAAVLALLSGLLRVRWKQPLARDTLFYALWAGWLLPVLFLVSYGGLIHRHYLDLLAPPVAALTAAGIVTWAADLRAGRRSGWLLPAAIALTAVTAFLLLGYYPEAGWLAWPILALGALTVLLLPVLRSRLGAGILAAISLPALLAVPLFWSTTPMWRGGDVILPYAGPDLIYWGGDRGVLQAYQPLADSLLERHGSQRFLVATENAVVAAPLQLLTGLPVMAMGGFTGVDPILDPQRLERLAPGDVRYFLLYSSTPTSSGNSGWIAAHCRLVHWNSIPQNMDLYDCGFP
ncbi:MAG: glycosyltransferase family 39 protein [Bacteroidota bacterium]